MKRSNRSICLLFAFMCSTVSAQQPRTSDYLETTTPTNLFSVFGGINVSVVIRSRDISVKDSDIWVGEAASVDKARTVRAIEELRINVGSSALLVPRSSYVDLMQVRKVALSGDASTSFH